MVLVVFSHIFTFSLGIDSSLNNFFCTFRMPLFFFVSGFFAYKKFRNWTEDRLKDILSRKFKVQIVGTTIFLALNLALMKHQFIGLWSFAADADGYWFTYVLFRIFIIYIISVVILKRLNKEAWLWVILWILAIMCVIIHYNIDTWVPSTSMGIGRIIVALISRHTFYYFPYFVFGLYVRSHLGLFEMVLCSERFRCWSISILLFFWACAALSLINSPLAHLKDSLYAYPLGIVTLLTVISLFYNWRFKFEENNKFTKSVKFIGRRTLDIYFLHYFFLPNLRFMRNFMLTYDSPFMQFVLGVTVSLIVVGVSLFAGQILRLSSTLSLWLLGSRKQTKAIG